MSPNPLQRTPHPRFVERSLLRCFSREILRLRSAAPARCRCAGNEHHTGTPRSNGSGASSALQSLGATTLRHGAILVLALLLSACASTNRHLAGNAPAFVIVRHAEKADDGSKDPPLTSSGEARANRLAAALRGTSLRAVYATAYRRTQATAAPAAMLHGLSVITYDARLPADEFAQRLRRDHLRGTVLVVAHSNTAPQIAAALCTCEVRAMDDNEFDRRMLIRFDASGRATFEEERY